MISNGVDPNTLRFRNVNIINLKNEVETLDKPEVNIATATPTQKEKLKEFSLKIFRDSAFFVNQKHDKVMTTASTADAIIYWMKKLGNSIRSLSGKGTGIINPAIYYNDIQLSSAAGSGMGAAGGAAAEGLS